MNRNEEKEWCHLSGPKIRDGIGGKTLSPQVYFQCFWSSLKNMLENYYYYQIRLQEKLSQKPLAVHKQVQYRNSCQMGS